MLKLTRKWSTNAFLLSEIYWFRCFHFTNIWPRIFCSKITLSAIFQSVQWYLNIQHLILTQFNVFLADFLKFIKNRTSKRPLIKAKVNFFFVNEQLYIVLQRLHKYQIYFQNIMVKSFETIYFFLKELLSIVSGKFLEYLTWIFDPILVLVFQQWTSFKNLAAVTVVIVNTERWER